MCRLVFLTVFSALAVVAQASERSASLNELVRSNPSAALRALADEEPRSFQGSLRTLVYDNPATGQTETSVTLQVGDQAYPVYSAEEAQGNCSGLADVRGFLVDGQILAVSISSAGPLNSPACSSIGDQKTVVLLVDTPGHKLPVGGTLTVPFVQGFMSTGTGPTVDGYFREVSGQKVTVTTDVFGVFTLAADYPCVQDNTMLLAAMAAADGSVDFTKYSRILMIAPRPTNTCTSRVSTVSCQSLSTPGDGALVASWAYIASDLVTTVPAGVNLAVKAIGYGMGAGAAYTRDFGNVAIGPFGVGGTLLLDDQHSIMGDFLSYSNVFPLGHVSPRTKVQLGWYAAGTDFLNVQTNSANTILPAASSTPGVKALRVRRGTGYNEWLWVEHRTFTGLYDSTLQNYAPTLASGVLISDERPTDVANRSYLLNFQPTTAPNNFKKAVLPAGSTWVDPSSNLSLQVASVTGGMQVTATYGPTGGCVYTPSQSNFVVTSAAGTSGFTVTTGAFCDWVISTTSPFVTVTSTAAGTGSTNVTFSYTANSGAARTSTIDVAGVSITLNQGSGLAGSLQITGGVTVSGTALAGVSMVLTGSANQTATTNASGAFALTGLASGQYTLTPVLYGYNFTPINATFSPLSANQVTNFTATKLPAVLSLDRSRLNFAARSAAVFTPAQKLGVSFGGGAAAWTAATNQSWLQVSPTSGSGPARLTVSLVPGALPDIGAVATVTVSAPSATPTSKTVQIYFGRVPNSGAPFGSFDTPTNNAPNVAGSIAVTGWTLDDVYVSKVEIYRDKLGNEAVQPNGYVYIGIALFVPDTRSDIESLGNALPFQYRGGWGYMMLTNSVYNPNGPQGDGTIKLWAIATDIEGNTTNLGSKVITLKNSTATLPFGALDAPGPGETVSGTSYRSNGWALTPQPNIITAAPSGATMYIDSVPIGLVTYGQFRSDLATFFPSYRNSSGAGGYYDLDTTKWANGQHTVQWTVTDDAGNVDGVGSRYFTIENGVAGAIAGPVAPPVAAEMLDPATTRALANRPKRMAVPQVMKVEELARLVIPLPEGQWTGAQMVNGEARPLPVGSTLDNASGAFYWNVGMGFLGPQELLFKGSDGAVYGMTIHVQPKRYGAQSSSDVQ